MRDGQGSPDPVARAPATVWEVKRSRSGVIYNLPYYVMDPTRGQVATKIVGASAHRGPAQASGLGQAKTPTY